MERRLCQKTPAAEALPTCVAVPTRPAHTCVQAIPSCPPCRAVDAGATPPLSEEPQCRAACEARPACWGLSLCRGQSARRPDWAAPHRRTEHQDSRAARAVGREPVPSVPRVEVVPAGIES